MPSCPTCTGQSWSLVSGYARHCTNHEVGRQRPPGSPQHWPCPTRPVVIGACPPTPPRLASNTSRRWSPLFHVRLCVTGTASVCTIPSRHGVVSSSAMCNWRRYGTHRCPALPVFLSSTHRAVCTRNIRLDLVNLPGCQSSSWREPLPPAYSDQPLPPSAAVQQARWSAASANTPPHNCGTFQNAEEKEAHEAEEPEAEEPERSSVSCQVQRPGTAVSGMVRWYGTVLSRKGSY